MTTVFIMCLCDFSSYLFLILENLAKIYIERYMWRTKQNWRIDKHVLFWLIILLNLEKYLWIFHFDDPFQCVAGTVHRLIHVFLLLLALKNKTTHSVWHRQFYTESWAWCLLLMSYWAYFVTSFALIFLVYKMCWITRTFLIFVRIKYDYVCKVTNIVFGTESVTKDLCCCDLIFPSREICKDC